MPHRMQFPACLMVLLAGLLLGAGTDTTAPGRAGTGTTAPSRAATDTTAPARMAPDAPAKAATPGNTKPTWDDYRIILDRNIFARDRSAPSATHRSIAPSTPPVEESIVLTGVAVRGDARVAFFENTRTGETVRAVPGGVLAGGSVSAISLDSVDYRAGEATRTISVGQNLAGLVAVLSPPAASPPSTPVGTTQPARASGAAATVDAAKPEEKVDKTTNDIIERMRLRRLQETKK